MRISIFLLLPSFLHSYWYIGTNSTLPSYCRLQMVLFSWRKNENVKPVWKYIIFHEKSLILKFFSITLTFCCSLVKNLFSEYWYFLSKCILKLMSIITGCFLPSFLHICWLFQHHLNLPSYSRHVEFYHPGISLHSDIPNLSYPHLYPKFRKMPKMQCPFWLETVRYRDMDMFINNDY